MKLRWPLVAAVMIGLPAGCGKPDSKARPADRPAAATTPAEEEAAAAEDKGSNTAAANAAIQRVRELGGTVQFDEAGSVLAVDLPECQAVDEDVKLMTAFSRLHSLSVRSAGITDEVVEHLGAFSELRHVHLLFANITNRAVLQLVDVADLETLDLRGCGRVGDAGLVHLEKLKNLRTLQLQGPQITDAGNLALP